MAAGANTLSSAHITLTQQSDGPTVSSTKSTVLSVKSTGWEVVITSEKGSSRSMQTMPSEGGNYIPCRLLDEGTRGMGEPLVPIGHPSGSCLSLGTHMVRHTRASACSRIVSTSWYLV
jgi:hypothetical protein